MQILLILSTAWIVNAGVVQEEKKCDGVFINNVYFDKEVLKSDIDRPFLLATDYSRNIVYFSYSVNKEDDQFKSAYVNLNTKEFVIIEGVNNGFAQTVDQKTHSVYIGGSKGIYKYDQESKKVEHIAAEKSDIWCIYYKDNVYYSDFPGQFLYSVIDGQIVKVKDLEDTKVDHFLIDNDDTFFYTNATGLYHQRKGTKDAFLYEELPSDGVRGINMDAQGTVYTCRENGIYRLDKNAVTMQKVVDLEDGFGVAFDNENNIIYSDATNLFRLKLSNEKGCM